MTRKRYVKLVRGIASKICKRNGNTFNGSIQRFISTRNMSNLEVGSYQDAWNCLYKYLGELYGMKER